ncbi:hypothetical protein PMIN04_013181, partial [Paraphaeosphaeria minitans]
RVVPVGVAGNHHLRVRVAQPLSLHQLVDRLQPAAKLLHVLLPGPRRRGQVWDVYGYNDQPPSAYVRHHSRNICRVYL